jgi:hypothetical protein
MTVLGPSEGAVGWYSPSPPFAPFAFGLDFSERGPSGPPFVALRGARPSGFAPVFADPAAPPFALFLEATGLGFEPVDLDCERVDLDFGPVRLGFEPVALDFESAGLGFEAAELLSPDEEPRERERAGGLESSCREGFGSHSDASPESEPALVAARLSVSSAIAFTP